MPPKYLSRGEARRPATDNYNFLGRSSRSFGERLWLINPLTNKNPAVSLLDPPAGKRTYGRRAQSFAAAQIKAGVMPRASDAVSDYKAFTKRTVVMAAMCGDGKYLSRASDQQDFLVANMTCQFSIGKVCKRNALRQIGATGPGFLFRHVVHASVTPRCPVLGMARDLEVHLNTSIVLKLRRQSRRPMVLNPDTYFDDHKIERFMWLFGILCGITR